MTAAAEARPTRGRMSRIDGLDPEVKGELDRLLRSGVPQTAILEHVRQAGGEVSRSGLNRYATRMEAVGAHIRESRAVAEAWIARIGQAPTGEVGQIIIEIVRTLAFRAALRSAEADPDDPEARLDISDLGDLALAVQRLERAAEIGREREAKIRAAERAENAEAASREARKAGLGADAAAAIREALIGRRPT